MTIKEALYQIHNTLESITLPIREAQAINEIVSADTLAQSCIQALEESYERQEAEQVEAEALPNQFENIEE